MKKLFSNPLFHLAIILFVVLGLEGYLMVHAQYMPPANQPPFDSSYPPLDTGSSLQTKSGSLVVGNSSQALRLQLSPAGIQWVDSNGNVSSSMTYDINLQGIRVTAGGYSSVLGYNWQSSNGGALISNGPLVVGASNPNSVSSLSSGNLVIPDLSVVGPDGSSSLNFYANPLGNENRQGLGPVILSGGYFSTNSMLAKNGNTAVTGPESGIFVNPAGGFIALGTSIGSTKDSSFSNSSLYFAGPVLKIYANGDVDALQGSVEYARPPDSANASVFSKIVAGGVSANSQLMTQLYNNTSTYNNDVQIVDQSGSMVENCPDGYFVSGVAFGHGKNDTKEAIMLMCARMFPSF